MLSHKGVILIFYYFCLLTMMFSYATSVDMVTDDNSNCTCMEYWRCRERGGFPKKFCTDWSTYCCFLQKRETDLAWAKGNQVSEADEWTRKGRGNMNMSCESYETECAFGCCPYAEGVCCIDGFECCQHEQTCIPILGICIGLENKNGEATLISNKSTPVKSSIPCPPGTTTCGEGKCCPFENATCCSDGNHCCPHGYRCDLVHRKCIKTNNELDNELDSGERALHPQKTIMKSSYKYKSCPGRGKVCPSSTSCCINDYNDWDCCPKPHSPQIEAGDPICCKSIWGHICCTNEDYPFCTPFGCI